MRIGIGGPVGSGKTALVAALCRALADTVALVVVTNDIFTTEDAEALRRMAVLADDRIVAVETGCPSDLSVVITDGFGLRSMATAVSGSGGLDTVSPHLSRLPFHDSGKAVERGDHTHGPPGLVAGRDHGT